MRPEKLTIQAFGSYGHKTEIDFTKATQNLFLVTGDTGSGKTTIFDAIVFALYGEASSDSNKKDGVELQSQYAKAGEEPFVEFVFSEKNEGALQKYTVKRRPRFIRPAKRKNSKDQLVSEEVELKMPDDSVIASKETNAKIESIVGLNKSQFMQVGMIAQGEFMRLLREKSNDKKLIFRKLFGTEMYSNIVNELKKRSDEKENVITKIKTECVTEANHIIVPDGSQKSQELNEVLGRITTSQDFNVTDMELLMEDLEFVCSELDEMQRSAGETYEKALKEKDRYRDDFTKAESLNASFDQYDTAVKRLEELSLSADEVIEKEKLAVVIDNSYEIMSVEKRYTDADTALKNMTDELGVLRDRLPERERELEKKTESEQTAQHQCSQSKDEFAKVQEKSARAKKIFGKIEAVQKELKRAKTEHEKKLVENRELDEKISEFEKEQQSCRTEAAILEQAAVRYEGWKAVKADADAIMSEIDGHEQLLKDLEKQEKEKAAAAEEFTKAYDRFSKLKKEYDTKHMLFFEAQAGVLAKGLKDGEPCPVCGSLSHPHPCSLPDEHEEITKEALEELDKKVKELDELQSECSGKSGSAAALYKEKLSNCESNLEKIRAHMKESIQALPDISNLEEAEKCALDHKKLVDEEGQILKKNADRLAQLSSIINGAEERRHELSESREKLTQELERTKEKVVENETSLQSLEDQKEYDSIEAAENDYEKAGRENDLNKKLYDAAKKEKYEASTAFDQDSALIKRFEAELPEKKTQEDERRKEYLSIMKEKDLSESEWKAVTLKYDKSEAERLREEAGKYRTDTAAAEGSKKTAMDAINGRQRPDIEKLKELQDTAREAFTEAENRYIQVKEECKADRAAYSVLSPKMKERKKTAEEYSKIYGLYRRLSGNMTGSRMDIETYVQRYYLKRILNSANLRFGEMSAGQFELRMVSEDQAGEGKNKGLDLMVYSTVTGKEREVRTLSGGESFMAALSLALGMADQIQGNSSSVNLDMLFIDEGFGSLDDNSRNQAVRVLKEMAGGSKLIGIISHVAELKQEIDDQLIVTKGEDGSHVKWLLC